MTNQIFATKLHMAQSFQEGKRVPVTILSIPKQVITQVKSTQSKDGYPAIQIAIGKKNRPSNKPTAGHLKKSKLKTQPRWIREIRLSSNSSLKLGDQLSINQTLAIGDTVKVTGTSLGKGFSGTIKRHGFSAQPRTHGQSDRRRAPGSIGRGTTPGRVLPGKKMSGRMGGVTKSVTNLKVVSIDPESGQVTVSGPIPGPKNGLIRLTVTKKAKN